MTLKGRQSTVVQRANSTAKCLNLNRHSTTNYEGRCLNLSGPQQPHKPNQENINSTCFRELLQRLCEPLYVKNLRTMSNTQESESSSMVSNSLQTYGLQPARLLCLLESPGKIIGVGSHTLLQGFFLTQELNPCLLCLLLWQVGSLLLVLPGKPNLDSSSLIKQYQFLLEGYL